MRSRRRSRVAAADRTHGSRDDPLSVGPNFHSQAKPDPAETQQAVAETRALEPGERRIGKEGSALNHDLVAASDDDVIARVPCLDHERGQRLDGAERDAGPPGRRRHEPVERRSIGDARTGTCARRVNAAGTVRHRAAALYTAATRGRARASAAGRRQRGASHASFDANGDPGTAGGVRLTVRPPQARRPDAAVLMQGQSRWPRSASPISTPPLGKYSRQRRLTRSAVPASALSSCGYHGFMRASMTIGPR